MPENRSFIVPAEAVTYFKSERDMYIFALIIAEGKQRNNLLNITDECYDKYSAAVNWHNYIINIIGEPDTDAARLALAKLDIIFDNITDHTYMEG